MIKLKQKFLVKIPSNVKSYCHSDKTNILFESSFKKKKLKSNFILLFLKDPRNNSYIYVTSRKSNNGDHSNQINEQLTTVYQIKKIFMQLLNNICIKLKLVGVGYKALKTENSNFLHLKLGYSHSIFFKFPSYFKVDILKGNLIYISGSSLENLSSFAALVRSYKLPEPYKGKGILYLNENIKLKIGKKV